MTLGEDCLLTISGYAFANGSQKKILYSLDKENWFEVQGGTYADASNDLVQTVMANGWIKSASAGHAVFENVGVDLSEYKGQTVTVSFAVTPGADDKALHFLTIENLLVPAPVETTEETTEQATEEICCFYLGKRYKDSENVYFTKNCRYVLGIHKLSCGRT